MMLGDLWRRVKRNPVINAFIAAVALQFAQDYLAGNIDRTHISGYLATLCLGIIARMAVVPRKEAEAARMRALAMPRPVPVDIEGDDVDRRD